MQMIIKEAFPIHWKTRHKMKKTRETLVVSLVFLLIKGLKKKQLLNFVY